MLYCQFGYDQNQRRADEITTSNTTLSNAAIDQGRQGFSPSRNTTAKRRHVAIAGLGKVALKTRQAKHPVKGAGPMI